MVFNTSSIVTYVSLRRGHLVLLLFVDICQAADVAFETEREKAKEADALAQIFRISGDLVKTRLLISQVRIFSSLPLRIM